MAFEADAQLLEKLFRIRTMYDGEYIVVDGRPMLSFSDLGEERDTILLNIQRVGSILAEAQHRLERMEVDCDAEKGRIDEHARTYEFGQKVTEDKVKNFILREPKYIHACKEVAKQRSIVRRLRILLGALRDKKDLIVEKGADRRLEVQYEPGISKLPKRKGEQ